MVDDQNFQNLSKTPQHSRIDRAGIKNLEQFFGHLFNVIVFFDGENIVVADLFYQPRI